MENQSELEILLLSLNQLRDELSLISLMLKDYKANLDIQGDGQTLKYAMEVLASAKQGYTPKIDQNYSQDDANRQLDARRLQ